MTRAEELIAEAKRRADTRDGRRMLPYPLHPKQEEFLALTEREALYGGAAGGGKSDALLAGPAQYLHVPNYAALLLRRTYADLKLPGAIMNRAHKWWGRTAAKWNAQDHCYTFPSGAVVQFGYCDNEADLGRYKSAEVQYIGIDELTEWPEPWYRFLFSRLRRLKGMDVPIRMRSATNPDGIGQEWVRARFGIPLGVAPTDSIRATPDRVFLPARAEDNPTLDLAEYEETLKNLGAGKYKQLRYGLWIRDGQGLVYSFDEAKNLAPARLRWAPGAGWSTIISHDYGVTNATSWNVLGWRPHDPVVYLIESFKLRDQSPSEAAAITKRLDEKYSPDHMVGDSGGLGKGYIDEARKRYHLPIEAAEKKNKRGYIELLNGDLTGGLFQVLADGCADYLEEVKILPWAKAKIPGERKEEAAGFENHCCDGVLYGWRAAQAFLAEPEKHKPAPGTPEAWAAEEDAAVDRRVEELNRGDSTDWLNL